MTYAKSRKYGISEAGSPASGGRGSFCFPPGAREVKKNENTVKIRKKHLKKSLICGIIKLNWYTLLYYRRFRVIYRKIYTYRNPIAQEVRQHE